MVNGLKETGNYRIMIVGTVDRVMEDDRIEVQISNDKSTELNPRSQKRQRN